MITPQDAALASRDPGLPGLATVLDPEALAALLPSSMRYLEAARIAYVRYKPGQSCVVGYSAQIDGVVGVYAKVHKARARAPEKSTRPDERGRQRFVIEQGAVKVSVFPTDAKLQALCGLATRESFEHLLDDLIPERAGWWSATLRPLRYMPERRYVAQLVTNGGAVAAIKAYTEVDYPQARSNADAFRSRGPLSLAPLLARSDRHRLLVFEWIEGRTLSDALTDPAFDGHQLSVAGAALAQLHSGRSDPLTSATRADETATVRALGGYLRVLCPDNAPRLDALARRLAGYLDRLPPVHFPIHGDFSPQQVVLANGGATLIDFDWSVRGDPALDLGLFLAHLERRVLLGRLPADRLGPLRRAFLSGYRSERGSIPDNLEPYVALGLLRLAPHSFRYRDADWPGCIEAALGRAEAIANGAHLRRSRVTERTPAMASFGSAGVGRLRTF